MTASEAECTLLRADLRERLIRMWTECFGDSEATAREFFACRGVNTVMLNSGETVSAMASLVPVEVRRQGGRTSLRGFYIYGVCVGPQYRGRGLFREVMAEAESRAVITGGGFVCLIPADEGLARTYGKMGYSSEIEPHTALGQGNIRLLSEDFRRFAVPSGEGGKTCGMIKYLCDERADEPLAFADFMGDA
ncbi:MAG: GNAT family N-acetyltransferase [Eubacteriales bacterium]